ncbi:MAG: hypothetical protein Q8Q15_02610 [bacterium]|nr:hypothetical protein [bacterium]
MQFGVNLAPSKQNIPASVGLGKIKFFVGIILFVYVIGSAALFGFTFYISSSAQAVATDIKQTEAKLKNYEKKEMLATTLKERMTMVDEILSVKEVVTNKGTNQSQLLTWVKGLTSSGVIINELKISKNDVTFSGKASSVAGIGNFIDQFQGDDKRFSLMSLDTLSRSTKGIYSFSLRANF